MESSTFHGNGPVADTLTATTHRAINYGAALQTYALQAVQNKLNIDNKVIDTEKKKSLYEQFPKNLISKRALIVLATNFTYFFHQREMHTVLRRFDEFLCENVKMTECYKNLEELEKNLPKASTYLNGSDQVFGLRSEIDHFRMMEFLKHSEKRVSYAASLGEYDWNEEEKKKFSALISRFSHVSVREQYAKDYIESFAPVHCEVNIDPTLLLKKEEWSALAKKTDIPEGPYILCYALLSNQNTQKVIDELKEKTGYPVVYVHALPMKRIKADKYIFDAGPGEFLWLFEHAEYVVTTSFHGTAFSVIFEKKFYSLVKNYKAQRMIDFLKLLNLSDRLIESDKEFSVTTDEIDFTKTEEILQKEREKSLQYLKEAIL